MASVATSRRFGVNAGAAIKTPCKAATTANITLSGEQTIDGVSCVTGDRVLVMNQTDASQNGIYEVDTSAWKRAPDWDGYADVVEGTVVYVNDGTTNIGYWKVTTSGTITVGTTDVSLIGIDTLSVRDDIAAGNTAISQWQDAQTATYISGTRFSVVGDVTIKHSNARRWTVGDRVKVEGSATGTITGKVTAISYSSPITTVTVTWDSGSLSNEALTAWVGLPNAYDRGSSLPDVPAAHTTVADAGSYFTGTQAEAVLQELGSRTWWATDASETGVTDNNYKQGDARRYGYVGDGLTDDHTALQNAHDSAVALGIFHVYLPVGSTAYVGSQLNISPKLTWWTRGYCHITTDLAIGKLFLVQTQFGDVSTYNIGKLFSGNIAIENTAAGNTAACFEFGGATAATDAAAFLDFDGMSITGFYDALVYKSNAYIHGFERCYFRSNVNVVSLTTLESGVGERIVFDRCVIDSNTQVLNISATGMDIFFNGCSLDYNNSIGIAALTSCNVRFEGGHIEWNNTTNTLFPACTSSQVVFDDVTFVFAGASAASPLIAKTGSAGWVEQRGCSFLIPISGVTLFDIDWSTGTFVGPSVVRSTNMAPATYVGNSGLGTLHTY